MEPIAKKYVPIKDWAEDDRPREKMLQKGKEALSNAELIAILLGSGTRELSAVQLAQQVLKLANDKLPELSKLSIKDLKKVKGIGEAKAIGIAAALELGARKRGAEILDRKRIGSSKDAFEFFHTLLADLAHEEFWILLLNRSHKIISPHKISGGGVAGTVVDPRIIFKTAIEQLASSIILCHNHPSGNTKPSQADIELTAKVKEGAKLLDISVIDHLIIADSSYYSFADNNTL